VVNPNDTCGKNNAMVIYKENLPRTIGIGGKQGSSSIEISSSKCMRGLSRQQFVSSSDDLLALFCVSFPKLSLFHDLVTKHVSNK
jgi:hypothetical protein